MKKRVLSVVLCLVMAMAAGCGGDPSKEKGKESGAEDGGTEAAESEGEEYIAWIREAWEEYMDSDIRGFVDSKFDGSQREVNTIDSDKQQWVTLSYESDYDADNPRYTDIRIKEGDKDYVFKQQRTGEDTYKDLKVLLDPAKSDEESYSDLIEKIEVLPFESNDKTEVVSVSAVQEGKENINGVEAVKIEVTYEAKLKEGEEYTREAVLNEYGWTEEQIELLSDFRVSELIDAYAESVNAMRKSEMSEPGINHLTYYLSDEDHKLLRRVEVVSSDEISTDAVYEVGQLVSSLKRMMEFGYSEEEAVQALRDEREGYWDFDYLMQSMMTVDTSGVEVTRDYQTADECEPMREIPADATEITWEQYENYDF